MRSATRSSSSIARRVPSGAFFGEITTAQCDGLHFSNVRSDGQIVKRTHSRIRRAREEVMLISVQVRGVGIIAQDGREARLQPGDFACYDSTRPYTLNFDAGFEQLVLHMPREAMVRRIGRTEVWTARRIEGTSPVGSLVLPFVQRTASIVADIAPATASRLSETCLSLVTAALGERLGDVAEGGSYGADRADLSRQGDHRQQSARSRAQHRASSPSWSAFRRAICRTCSTPKARRSATGSGSGGSTKAGATSPTRCAATTASRRLRWPAASPTSAISAAATRKRSGRRRATIGRCCAAAHRGQADRHREERSDEGSKPYRDWIASLRSQ